MVSNEEKKNQHQNCINGTFQVDGEPWIQPVGDIVVLRSALKVSSWPHCMFKLACMIFQAGVSACLSWLA